MSLRAATAEDAPAIAHVFEACWRDLYPGLVPQPVIERVAGAGLALWAGLLRPEATNWLVEVWGQPGEVSGVIRYGRDPDQIGAGHVFSLYVDPGANGRGIGTALLRHAQEWFVENGLSRATLWVFEANARARGFYATQRWRPDGQSRVEPEFDTPEVRLSWQAIESELEGLETERSRPELSELDTMAVPDLVRLMNEEDAGVAIAVGAAAGQISAAIDAVTQRLAANGRLIYIGAGTAGRLGILDATESVPTFNTKPGQVVGLIAGGGGAMVEAVEGAEDDASAGERDLRAIRLTPLDVVVGISASGRTPYVLGAVEYANQVGAASVGLACNRGTLLAAAAQYPIEVAVGPEMIAGSTRLKSGTAQKLVLNMISTIAMVRLGKTYGNLMIDLRATNEKLRARAQRIVQKAARTDPAEARRALDDADGEVKTAIVMLRTGTGAADARRRLERSGGNLRQALSESR
ncbi:MAG TPA: N-acetylmuramic acid 6-phosphate etherase [Candidatus Dormibacteraeota bacterium]